MGKIITFWSPVRGMSRVTSSLCAVMISFAMQYPQYEIAFSSVGKENTALEDSLGSYRKYMGREGLYSRSGMAAIVQNCMQNELTSARIKRCALPLFLPSLTLFPGLCQSDMLIHGREAEQLEEYVISECLCREYELLCLDVCGGNREKSLKYIQHADKAVIVLPQNPAVWERYREEYGEYFRNQSKGILLGGYTSLSKYGMTEYERRFMGKGEVMLGAVPWNEGYMDAVNDGKTIDFFLRNENVRRRENNYEFMESTKKAAKRLYDFIFL